MIATGSLDSARAAVAELEEIAVTHQREALQAMAAQARGELLLAEEHAADALPLLRQALAVWTDLGATYESARLREQLARACRLLGDEDTASFELDGALRTFEELGAAPDVSRLQAPDGKQASAFTASPVGKSKCCGAWLPARPIATSRTSCASANSLLPGTCRTSSPSSMSPRGPRRRPSPTPIVCSDRVVISHHVPR